MAEKKGICKNYVNCPLADKEEVQVVDDLNFVCAHCHQPLEPADDGGSKKPFDPKKLILICAVVALIGLIVGGYFLISSNKAKKQAEAERAAFVADSLRQVAEEQRIADSIRLAEEQAAEEARLAEEQEAEALRLAEEQRIADSIRVADSIRIADSLAAVKNKKTDKPAQSSGSSNWNGVATYNGPMQGGKPNGIGGKLTFKSNYSLDLKDGNGTKLDIKAGETIENTKFENGKLRQGELHRKDGTRKWFNI
jgi:hypothetical protein